MSSSFRRRTLAYIFVLAAVFMALAPTASVYADPPDVDTKKAIDSWPNWVGLCGTVTPGDAPDETAPSTDGTATTEPGPVYIMGDSITELSKDTYEKKFKENKWSPTIEGLSSRTITTTPPSPSGLQQIEKDKDKIAKANAVVIALGTNGSSLSQSAVKKNVQDAMFAVDKYKKGDAPVYWVNIIDTRSDSDSKSTNTAIKEAVGGQGGKVIDWYSAAKKDADLGSFDMGVHPTKQADKDLLVDLVYDSVSGGEASAPATGQTGCCSSSSSGTTIAPGGSEFVPDDQLPGKDNREKSWNYLKSLGFTDNEAAGAVGSIAVEGVFDPQSVEDGYGLVPRSKNPDDAGSYGWGLIGFTPGHSVFDFWAKNAGLSKEVDYDNIYYISTQLSIVHEYMKHVTGDGGGNMWKEYQDSSAKGVSEAALAWEAQVENAGVKASPERDAAAKAALEDFGSGDNSAASTSAAGCCPTGASFGAGTLPSSVPKPYNEILTAAAEKHKISPALLAAIFYGGEHGSSWPDPPPPYGHGEPWATSYAGANGPFQFILSTWDAYAQDGNGDGKKDVQDLTDAAFGAAAYLYASGARGSEVSTYHDAIYAYNHAEWYVDQVMVAYDKFAGTDSGSGSGGNSGGSSSSTTTVPSGCGTATGEIQQGSPAELAKMLLEYKKSGKYSCDNATDCEDLEKTVRGDSLAGTGGCTAKALDKRVLQMLLFAIEAGQFKVGTYALCGAHFDDGPTGHAGGFAVDISSVNGVGVVTDSRASRDNTLKMDQFLNKLPKELKVRQLISWGYGNHPYKPMGDLQIFDSKPCGGASACEAIYEPETELDHMNHIHAGY